MKPKIRIRIAGIYIRENKILLVKHKKAAAEYYLLPGGGQEPGESAKDALIREWKEELNLEIEPGPLLFLGESVPPEGLKKSQVLQLVFEVLNGTGKTYTKPSGALIGHEWVELSSLHHIKLFPRSLDQILSHISGKPVDYYQKYDWIKT